MVAPLFFLCFSCGLSIALNGAAAKRTVTVIIYYTLTLRLSAVIYPGCLWPFSISVQSKMISSLILESSGKATRGILKRTLECDFSLRLHRNYKEHSKVYESTFKLKQQ